MHFPEEALKENLFDSNLRTQLLEPLVLIKDLNLGERGILNSIALQELGNHLFLISDWYFLSREVRGNVLAIRREVPFFFPVLVIKENLLVHYGNR